MATDEKDDWTIEDAFAADRVLQDLARGATPKKPQSEVTLEERMERLKKELLLLGQLHNPDSQFRKDYENFVEASGKPCPLLRSIRRGDAYWAEKRKQMCSREIEQVDFTAPANDADNDNTLDFDDD